MSVYWLVKEPPFRARMGPSRFELYPRFLGIYLFRLQRQQQLPPGTSQGYSQRQLNLNYYRRLNFCLLLFSS